MIIGRSHTMLFSLLLASALIAPANTAQADSNQQTLEKLFANRTTQSAQHAQFVEIRTIGELDLPLESRGELHFEPPATLRKKTLAPLAETMELTGDSLSITINGTTRSLPLDAVPAAAALASALRGLLAGNAADVEAHFKMEFSASDASAWTLHLTPISRSVSNVLEQMTVSGAGTRIAQIEIRQTNGDESVMRILSSS